MKSHALQAILVLLMSLQDNIQLQQHLLRRHQQQEEEQEEDQQQAVQAFY